MSTIVIPSRPTPNGSLHLGHIAGPYLRADITKRYLEETGERAFLVSMPDIYDNWILQTLECGDDIDLIEHHIQSIRDGFEQFDIQFDCFGDPFGTQETVLMNDTLEMCIQALGSETFVWPYHHSDEKFLFGTELGTICSECKQTISGMICEDCCQLTMPTENAVGAVTLQSYQTPFVSISDDQRQDAERSVSQIYPMGVAELAARLAPRNHAHQFPLFLKVSKRSKSALPKLESFDCIPFTLSTHLIYKSVLCEIIHQTFNEMRFHITGKAKRCTNPIFIYHCCLPVIVGRSTLWRETLTEPDTTDVNAASDRLSVQRGECQYDLHLRTNILTG